MLKAKCVCNAYKFAKFVQSVTNVFNLNVMIITALKSNKSFVFLKNCCQLRFWLFRRLINYHTWWSINRN